MNTLDTARKVIDLERDALDALARHLDARFEQAVELILGTQGRVICAGVGKSGHIVRKIAATLASTGTPAQFVHPTEASHGDLGMITQQDTILMLSRSGETQELADLLHYARRYKIPVIAMTAVADSTLGRAGTPCLPIPNLAEACKDTNAPTVSTTLMMALGDALAVAVLKSRGFTADNFKVFHPGGKLGAMLLAASDVMATTALPLVTEAASITEAISSLSDGGHGCVGVIGTDGALKGMMTDGDVRRMFTQGLAPDTVTSAMTESPVSFSPDDLAVDILAAFNIRKITQTFIVDDKGKPIGLIHLHMLLSAGLR